MLANPSQQHVCNHPGRDVVTVGLFAAIVSLVSAIIVMANDGHTLAVLGASGTAFATVFTGGMGALSHLKRTAA
ncbi:hypothetical protein [Streptomyces sp. BH105]|uniref:hypothetical protein n=1 Tax=Streptomyces sp. BH105 TaxID=3410408 RepID=UPI003CF33A31